MADSWHVLSKSEQEKMLKEGNYLDPHAIFPAKLDKNTNFVYDSDIEEMLSIGDKLER